jgi:hypothetical protein
VVLLSVIWFLSWCVVRPALSGSRPVDLVHEPSVGLAGGGELVVAFFEFPARTAWRSAFSSAWIAAGLISALSRGPATFWAWRR